LGIAQDSDPASGRLRIRDSAPVSKLILENRPMVEINIDYEGQLRCRAVHGPSGAVLATDAPKDNMGKGEAFSPTDLVATALGTCIATTMGIVAQRHGLDVTGMTVRVQKEMVTEGIRRIGRLPVEVHVKGQFSPDDRKRLESAAHTCPVHKSLHPDVQAPIRFWWE
jgi:putative redox protein